MENAIKKAIEGGYEPIQQGRIEKDTPILIDGDLLNPFFWQSLSNALKWSHHLNYKSKYKILGKYYPEWHFHWHRFIDKLASGGTAEEFFSELF